MSSRNTCRVVVGRLLEVEPSDGYRSLADVDEMKARLSTTLAQVPAHVRPVIVADWRACKVLTPTVSEAVVVMMTSTNTRIERSALLHAADSSTSVLQLMRLIKETNAANRRLFTEPAALREWLSEVLDEKESLRLREFLMAKRPSSR